MKVEMNIRSAMLKGGELTLPISTLKNIFSPYFAQEQFSGAVGSAYAVILPEVVEKSLTPPVSPYYEAMPPAPPGWWDPNWTKRRAITISGYHPTDYQIKVVLPFYDASIRFLEDSTSGLLPYWVESYTSTSMTVWVKRSIANDGDDHTIYVYYGNPNAGSASSVTDTFIREINGATPLKGVWHLDENTGTTAYDDSGNGNNGTLINGPTWTAGKFKSALSFDGTNDHVDCGNSSTLNIETCTVAAWIKTTSTAIGCILTKMDTSLKRPYELIINNPPYPNKVELNTYDGTNYPRCPSTTSVNNDKWHFIVGVRNRTANTLKIYVDGSLERTVTDTTSVGGTLNTVNFWVGGRTVNSEYFAGIIDEVSVFNRALSATEILDLYNNYGYTTTNYPGRVLVRKYTDPEPTTSVGEEEQYGG
jgi:hypothetical protein